VSASRTSSPDAGQLEVELVCTWYDSPFVADRRRAFTLWSNGALYWAHRPSPAAVWSPQHGLGDDHDLASARRLAMTGRCRHERLSPPSRLVTAYLAERGGIR
jgi:hypothetical protein